MTKSSAHKAAAEKTRGTHRKPVRKVGAGKARGKDRKTASKAVAERARGTYRKTAAQFEEFTRDALTPKSMRTIAEKSSSDARALCALPGSSTGELGAICRRGWSGRRGAQPQGDRHCSAQYQ